MNGKNLYKIKNSHLCEFFIGQINYLQHFVEEVDFFPLQPLVFETEDVASFAASALEPLAHALLDAFFLPNIVIPPLIQGRTPCNNIVLHYKDFIQSTNKKK